MIFPPALPPALFLPVSSCLPGIHLRRMSSAMTIAAAVHAPTNNKSRNYSNLELVSFVWSGVVIWDWIVVILCFSAHYCNGFPWRCVNHEPALF